MVVGELAHERDLVIIGGGAGGYQAAIRASQLGKKVTLIERSELGGVCLNQGCIPSKILTRAADSYMTSKENIAFGIEYNQLLFHFDKLHAYKMKTIDQLKKGISALCESNQIEMIKGSAFFLTENKIGVENGEQYDVYRFAHAVIATGSSPLQHDGITPDYLRIHDSFSITSLEVLPETLLIYGSDYLSIEIAMAFQALGSKVTIVIAEDDFSFDLSINRELIRNLKRNQIKVIKNAKKFAVSQCLESITASFHLNGIVQEIVASHLFIASMIQPNTKEMGLDRIGISTDGLGFIHVTEQCRTSLSHIYAIGDVTQGPALAVKAIKQGKVAAEALTGICADADLRFIPTVAHTRPPIASAGLTEQQAIQEGYQVEIGHYPLSGNGYASVIGKKQGFVKIIMDKENHVLLGIHMMGEGVIELISNGITTLEMAARDEDLIAPLYPHPSINEGMMEAAEALRNQAIHIFSKPKEKKQKA
ncbi:dihydrolipoyl dehydrogenase family protein [Cytobacillus purgationiresistens]|uniref:Dihydrolipoamide dehydrogenase n=1 Tax=Cytobacillus purgationiresistens TaxID=863449 RepID=A0ABU0AEF5_9BACI|nr:FAD-dependent oxidoreductase [Cytobacillus purgationiresistens]MDQ0269633.1 dihydrolipoamide dehydrogenase [Cytobacillus purgationiresistens]